MQRILRKRIIAALLTGVMAAGMLTGCGAFNKKSEKEEQSSNTTSISEEKRVLKDDIVVQSANYALSKQIVSYLYNNYYNANREYAAYQGLDVTKSLKEQYYDSTNGVTWYDYFMNMTKQYLSQLLVLCEAAKAEGVELNDEDKASVETTVNSIKTAAKTAGLSEDEYIKKNFGEGVTAEGISKYLEMTALANRYYEKLYNSYQYTDEQYEKYYQENKTSYQYADFLRFKFNFASAADGESSVAEVNKDLKDKAKAYAEDLANSKTAQQFKDKLKKYYQNNKNLLPKQEGETLTEAEEAKLIDDQVAAAQIKKYAYEVTSPDGKWIFDASREALDTTVLEGDTAYTVIMVTKTAYRDESLYKNVRHILVTSSKFNGNETEARKRAEEIYNEWKHGDATEDSFAALAELYSEDPGSSSNGGLYTNVGEGDMVAEFNDWLFDSNRKVGDTDIVKTTYGYHIMYFSGNGDKVWKKSVDTVMRKNDYSEDYKKLVEKYEVKFDNAYLNTIEESEGVEESSAESSAQSQQASGAGKESSAQSQQAFDSSKAASQSA